MVNLSNIKLQKLPYGELLQFLATDKRVTSLDLSKNELGDEGAQAVATPNFARARELTASLSAN